MDVSDIFYFFCSGKGKGESEAPRGGGVRFLLKFPGGVGVLREGEGPGSCVCVANWGIWGGGNSFSGPKCPPSNTDAEIDGELLNLATQIQIQI